MSRQALRNKELMKRMSTGGELVVETLVSLGVRHIFGIPGGQTLAITDAILDRSDIEFITARHEGAAAVMADAYGRLTRTPGVCLATTGPGATNLLTGVGGAFRDSSPVLVITCNNNAENIEKDDAQAANHVEIFRPLTKWSRFVTHGSSIRQAIEEGYVNAVTGTPGPVLLDFARDAIEGPVSDSQPGAGPHPLRAWAGQRPAPDQQALAAAAAKVAASDRPVLWAGNGATGAGISRAVLAFAEEFQIPVITTFAGIGAVPTRHPMVFGPLSRMGTSLSSRVLSEADLVIAVGNSLNSVSTSRWRLELPDVLQIDVNPAMIGRYYGDRTFGVVSDAAAAIGALSEFLAGREEIAAAVAKRRRWVDGLRGVAEGWWDEAYAATARALTDEPDAGLSPADLVCHLRSVTPDETLLIADAGNPGVWSYFWEVREAGAYLKPVGFGNMGFGVPAAVAAAVLDPGRPVVVLVGDGSLGMTLGELETLARRGGRVVVVVMNDGGYGNIRQEQVFKYGQRTIGVDFGPADYAKVAEGLGLASGTATSLKSAGDLVAGALAAGRPALIDVPIDPTPSAWTYPLFRPYQAPAEGGQ